MSRLVIGVLSQFCLRLISTVRTRRYYLSLISERFCCGWNLNEAIRFLEKKQSGALSHYEKVACHLKYSVIYNFPVTYYTIGTAAQYCNVC